MQDSEYYSSKREDILSYIPQGIKKTLDVGCASGNFSDNLKQQIGVEVWGIELNPEVAKHAAAKLDKVLAGTFEDVSEALPKQYFDCVFFNDVLEHMPDPASCLMKVKENITPSGTIVASIPNVRHFEVLKELLFQYDWRYRDSGILDRTHLRFFTKKSIIRLFDQCGYDIKTIEGINRSNFKTWKMKLLLSIPFKILKDIEYTQYVVVATIKK